MQSAAKIGQEVTLTLSCMISCKYVLEYKDGPLKFFRHKHEGKSNAPRILARPIRTYKCSVVCVGVHEDCYDISVKDSEHRVILNLTFEHNHNVGFLRTEIAKTVNLKGHIMVEQFMNEDGSSMNGRCNGLKTLSAWMDPDVLEQFLHFLRRA